MKKHMNEVRCIWDCAEIINEGQSISDFYSPFKSADHTDRFTCLSYNSEKIEKTEKTEKNEEN